MNAETLTGLAVVSIADSSVVGHVEDVLFEPRQARSAAGQPALIPFAAVHHIGSDAVTIARADLVQWLTPTSTTAGLLHLAELVKLKVLDEAGTVLGTISRVVIDPEDGRISEVQVHHGGVLGLGGTTHTIAGEQIRSASRELMVVALPAEPVPEPQAGADDDAGPPVEPDRGRR